MSERIDPPKCPKCGSNHVTLTRVRDLGKDIVVAMCYKCGEEWTDGYLPPKVRL